MARPLDILALSAGGALGVNARYAVATLASGRLGPNFPWATFAINVSGSFAIGLLATVLPRWCPSQPARLFLIVGFLGGYTTFSSFAFEGLALWERGAVSRSILYLGGSVASGFLAVVLGVALGRNLAGPEPAAIPPPTSADEIRDGDEEP